VSSLAWGDWPPLPQFPAGRTVQPGRCATGSILLVLAENSDVVSIEFGNHLGDGTMFAEWLLGDGS
jgi:hypothetical protein